MHLVTIFDGITVTRMIVGCEEKAHTIAAVLSGVITGIVAVMRVSQDDAETIKKDRDENENARIEGINNQLRRIFN